MKNIFVCFESKATEDGEEIFKDHKFSVLCKLFRRLQLLVNLRHTHFLVMIFFSKKTTHMFMSEKNALCEHILCSIPEENTCVGSFNI